MKITFLKMNEIKILKFVLNQVSNLVYGPLFEAIFSGLFGSEKHVHVISARTRCVIFSAM